ncbi:MAG: hypothetical protein ACTSU5_14115 [Promethearchaeota archaeon]
METKEKHVRDFEDDRGPADTVKLPPPKRTLHWLLTSAFVTLFLVDLLIGWQSYFFMAFPVLLFSCGIFHGMFFLDDESAGWLWGGSYYIHPLGDLARKSQVFLASGCACLALLLVWGLDLRVHPQMFDSYAPPVTATMEVITAGAFFLSYNAQWRDVGASSVSQRGRVPGRTPSMWSLSPATRVKIFRVVLVYFVLVLSTTMLSIFLPEVSPFQESAPFRGNSYIPSYSINIFPVLLLVLSVAFGSILEVQSGRLFKGEIRALVDGSGVPSESPNFLAFLSSFYR